MNGIPQDAKETMLKLFSDLELSKQELQLLKKDVELQQRDLEVQLLKKDLATEQIKAQVNADLTNVNAQLHEALLTMKCLTPWNIIGM